jgi:hypothetical protein
MVDMSVQFVGETNAEYVATAAWAYSPVANQSRFLAYLGKDPAQSSKYNKQFQLALDATIQNPQVPFINYKKALKANATSTLEAHINFGEKAMSGAHVYLRAVGGQTPERVYYVKRSPMGKLCEQQMEEGDYVLPACRNITARANFLDQYNLTLKYQQVSDYVKNLTYHAYSVARHLGYYHVQENFINPDNKNGKIQLAVQLSPSLRFVNVSLDTPLFSSQFTNVSVNPWARPILASHPEYNVFQRVAQKAFRSQQFPTCVLDQNNAVTFDNRTYPITLGKCWHVFFQTASTSHPDSSSSNDKSDEVSVLVRDAEGRQEKEVKLILGTYEVNFVPGPEVQVNGKKVKLSQDKLSEYADEQGETLFQVYALQTGAVRFYAVQHDIEIIYDGARIKLQASNSYRGEVRGLCGTFDGETYTDFTSPRNCILRNPYEFAASYSIPSDSCQGPAKDLRRRAEKAECYKKEVILGQVVSEKEAGRFKIKDKKSHQSTNQANKKDQQPKPCSSLRIKMMEEEGKTCFSLKPYLTCSSKCKAVNMIEKMVDFHCIADSSAARHWAKIVKKGANPDFSGKPSNKRVTIRLPQQCVH